MLTAQPSTYDMFALIELYGRKVQSVYVYLLLANFSQNTNVKFQVYCNTETNYAFHTREGYPVVFKSTTVDKT